MMLMINEYSSRKLLVNGSPSSALICWQPCVKADHPSLLSPVRLSATIIAITQHCTSSAHWSWSHIEDRPPLPRLAKCRHFRLLFACRWRLFVERNLETDTKQFQNSFLNVVLQFQFHFNYADNQLRFARGCAQCEFV